MFPTHFRSRRRASQGLPMGVYHPSWMRRHASHVRSRMTHMRCTLLDLNTPSQTNLHVCNQFFHHPDDDGPSHCGTPLQEWAFSWAWQQLPKLASTPPLLGTAEAAPPCPPSSPKTAPKATQTCMGDLPSPTIKASLPPPCPRRGNVPTFYRRRRGCVLDTGAS